MKKVTIAIIMMFALHAGAALAQADEDVPPGTVGQGVITLEQITEELQSFRIERDGILLHFILPAGWDLVEEGIDPESGQLDENMPAYVLLAKSPIHSPDEPTDFIFELDIFKRGLTEDLPEDTPEDERHPIAQLMRFLNEQMTVNLKGGLTCRTRFRDIQAKPYGRTSPQREPTYFVPLTYDTPGGAELYTFTSYTGDKAWMIKFLVAEGQIDNYGALIALILENTYGLTEAQLEEIQSSTK